MRQRQQPKRTFWEFVETLPPGPSRPGPGSEEVKAIVDFLHRLGVPAWRAWIGALSGKGWWRLSGSPPATEGMSLAWFESQGLVSLVRRYEQLNR